MDNIPSISPARAFPFVLLPGALSLIFCCLNFSASIAFRFSRSYSMSSLPFVIARLRAPADAKADKTLFMVGDLASPSMGLGSERSRLVGRA